MYRTGSMKGVAGTLPDRVTGEPEACAGRSGQEALARLFAPALREQRCLLACPSVISLLDCSR